MVRTAPPHKKYGKGFGKLVENVCSHNSQGMPKFLINRHVVEGKKISVEDQEDYWLGVGL